MNIVQTAIANGSFETLVAAVTVAELVDTLNGEGPFTVFAPVDAAFAALPEGTVATLIIPENKEKLQSILTYHVVAGKVLSSDLSDGMEATTVTGASLTIRLEDGKVFDSSYPRKKPIEFPLGMGNVIEGWDEGIALLQVGDKARFVIPSDLAYGSRGAGGVIPPNATLIFDVELMDVK